MIRDNVKAFVGRLGGGLSKKNARIGTGLKFRSISWT